MPLPDGMAVGIKMRPECSGKFSLQSPKMHLLRFHRFLHWKKKHIVLESYIVRQREKDTQGKETIDRWKDRKRRDWE